jgi:uncharacterized protein (TIGR02268 family)
MLTVLPSLLFLAVLQSVPVVQPTAAACQDVQRIELSLVRGASQEICVSPGLLTGFVFDSRVTVDLEQEFRFAEVIRGTTSFSVMPPGDGLAGERLRLTAHFSDGASVTFVLVFHSGLATRQVEVYRDKRTRESFQHEVTQAEARIQQLKRTTELLQHQLEQLRAECGDPRGLRRLIASSALDKGGLQAMAFSLKLIDQVKGALSLSHGVAYRSINRVALEVWVTNSSTEPWTISAASLVDAKGNSLKGIQFWQDSAFIPPGITRLVVVEADGGPELARREVTLSLQGAGAHGITLSKVALP